MSKSRGWLWMMLVVLLAAAASAGGYWWLKRRAPAAPQYTTVAVSRGDLTQTVTATGQLNPVQNVQVGSQISGTIQKLHADYNANVVAGQVIAQIDPATYQANVSQAEGELANARASLELAKINARRAAELFAQKLIPQAEHDTAHASLQQAEAVVKIRQAALARAEVDLARCTIYSPINGTVISRSVDVGQTVAASLSAPTLFVIANDLTKMQINANVAEADIGGVAVGQEVDFSVDAFPNRRFHGEVTQVRNAPITVQNVVSYDTIIGVANPELLLRPGMTANVSIITAQRTNALKVPNAALRFRPPDTAGTNTANRAGAGQRGGGGTSGRPPGGRPRGDRPVARQVYVLKEGRPEPVQVKTGISDGVATEIIEGLTENDPVITSSNTPAARGAAPTGGPFGGPMGPRRF